MAQAIDLRRPDAEQSRTELTLGRIGRAWQGRAQGRRFAEALVDFLRSIRNPNTLRSYSYSILQFFEWYESEKRSIPTPSEIRRAEAVEYVNWLSRHEDPLIRYRLDHDPERKLDQAIFDIVASKPGANITHIRDELMRLPGMATYYAGVAYLRIEHPELGRPGTLAFRLGCLVKRRTLTRTPTVEEVRRAESGHVFMPPADIFRYDVPRIAQPAAERVSAMLTRVAALASFWEHLKRGGENVPGGGQRLLQFNIWTDLMRQLQAPAVSQRALSRAERTPGPVLFLRLLATTFFRTHGRDENALVAAEAAFWGRPLPRARFPVPVAFKDVRDRALLLFMAQTGARSGEVEYVRRQDYGGEPPMVKLLGKRNLVRQLRVPEPTAAALAALDKKLQAIARHQERYGGRQRARSLLEPDAPLLPAIAYWGANAGAVDAGLSRPAIAMMLRRRAIAAGIDPGTSDFIRAHPHGFRHLFAKMAADAGTPVHVVQAMMGHTSAATTGRYMEERAPEALISKAFAPPPVIASVRPLEALPPTELPEPVVVKREPRPTKALGEASEAFEAYLHEIASWRGKPLTAAENKVVQKCRSIGSESLRNLCAIYQVHWGENGNRQELLKTGGGRKRALPNQAEEQEELYEEEEPLSLEEELAEIPKLEERIQAIERPTTLHAGAGTDKAWRIYSGKDSGLSWWTGTNGRLHPELPVMSPEQVGFCRPDRQNAICTELVELWKKWSQEAPTKAQALVRWIGEALDVAAQMEGVVVDRQGSWVGPDAPWLETQFRGARRSPEPRMIFRAHLDSEVVAWFEAAAGRYRTSPGDPTSFREGDEPKVDEEAPPDWYEREDPIYDLPPSERRELLDWLLALTGQLPNDDGPRFEIPGGGYASRRAIAEWMAAVCRYDQQLDAFREDPAFGPQFVASLIRKGDDERMPTELRTTARDAAYAMDRATGGRVRDFNLHAVVRTRVTKREAKRRGKEDSGRETRKKWLLRLVRQYFGEEAVKDASLELVAQCGDVPLGDFRDLFRIAGGTVEHTTDYKRAFAEAFGTHSECVARRIARELWEIHKHRPKSEYLTRPQFTVTLVEVMRTFKVPCSPRQERELAALLPYGVDPESIYQVWQRVHIPEGPEREELEAEEQERELSEEFEEERARAFAAEVLGAGMEKNPRRPKVPTPVHLVWAVQRRNPSIHAR